MPLPIQDEVIEETPQRDDNNTVEMQEVPEASDADMEVVNEPADEQVTDTGEVENDE